MQPNGTLIKQNRFNRAAALVEDTWQKTTVTISLYRRGDGYGIEVWTTFDPAIDNVADNGSIITSGFRSTLPYREYTNEEILVESINHIDTITRNLAVKNFDIDYASFEEIV